MIDRPDGRIAVREVDEVPLASDYDCRVSVLYGAICAGTDRHILHDRLPWRMEYPCVLGHESVGRVTYTGPKVRHFQVGDLIARVGTAADPEGRWAIGWGGFAESGFARDWRAMQEDGLPEAQWDAFRIHRIIPPQLAPEDAPLFITLRETLSYANRLGVTAGTRLLVIGSGGNALAFVHHARQAGAAAIVVLGAAGRETVFRAAGATDYRDYRSVESVAAIAARFPDGFDRLIDSVGRADALDHFLPLLSDGGTIGIYGLDEWDRLTLHPVRARGTFTLYQGGYDEPETHDAIVERLTTGAADPTWWFGVDRTVFPLERIADAFAAIERRELIKPLIRIGG
jgi:threonine dehydrogenase-like Zn-dependent dehydrogenase